MEGSGTDQKLPLSIRGQSRALRVAVGTGTNSPFLAIQLTPCYNTPTLNGDSHEAFYHSDPRRPVDCVF